METAQQVHRCGLCGMEFRGRTAELEYVGHKCAASGHRPVEPAHAGPQAVGVTYGVGPAAEHAARP